MSPHPLPLRCQRRRRLPLWRIGLRGRIVGVVLYWWGIVLLVSPTPLILAGPSGPFRVVFPTWSLLFLWILDNKARCAELTVFPLLKGNFGSFLRLLSVGSSEALFSPFWLGQSSCFQLGSWRWTCRGRKRMVRMWVWRWLFHASLSSSLPPIVFLLDACGCFVCWCQRGKIRWRVRRRGRWSCSSPLSGLPSELNPKQANNHAAELSIIGELRITSAAAGSILFEAPNDAAHKMTYH